MSFWFDCYCCYWFPLSFPVFIKLCCILKKKLCSRFIYLWINSYLIDDISSANIYNPSFFGIDSELSWPPHLFPTHRLRLLMQAVGETRPPKRGGRILTLQQKHHIEMLGNNVTWICGRRTGGCINQTEKNRRFENKKKKDNKKWKKKQFSSSPSIQSFLWN